MRVATESSPEWVIKETTFFDHQTHRFVVGDIEIDGERISAITPPGASARAWSLDARRYVCTPGLVSAHTALRNIEAPFDRLLQAGITTAGRICATAGECIAVTSQTRVRSHLVRSNARATMQPWRRAHATRCPTRPRRDWQRRHELASRRSPTLQARFTKWRRLAEKAVSKTSDITGFADTRSFHCTYCRCWRTRFITLIL